MSPFPHYALQLLPEGAVFLEKTSTLVIADVHLGKAATFRAKGLPIPEGDNARDFQRILRLCKKYHAAHLIIAGDLFHARAGITPELQVALGDFLAALAIPATLITGNHDRRLVSLPAQLHPAAALALDSQIRVVHDPADATGDQLHLAGHWHPVVKIPDGDRTSLRLPCFLLRGNTLTLPAFGSFTGGAIMTPQPQDRIFVTLRDAVVELPTSLLERSRRKSGKAKNSN